MNAHRAFMGCENPSSIAVGATAFALPAFGRGGADAYNRLHRRRSAQTLLSTGFLNSPLTIAGVATGSFAGSPHMQRFSKRFWLTTLAAAVGSGLLNYALVWHFTGQLHDMVALCSPRHDSCGSEAIDHAFRVFCLAAMAGAVLVFWLAHRMGRSLLKPAATDTAR